jgi:hypothetical protein
MVSEIATFRIYPEKRTSRLYFQVRVFSSVTAIRRYLKYSDLNRRTLGRYGLAMCSTFDVLKGKRGRWRKQPIMGEILFPVRGLRAGVIAHECTHAALGWARRIGLNPVSAAVKQGRCLVADANEERFCYALGELNRQIAIQIWERGLSK